MKKFITLSSVLILLSNICFSAKPKGKSKFEAKPSIASVYAGYGVHKIVIRGDYKLSEKWIKVDNSSTRIYFDLGFDWQKFDEDFYFKSDPYSNSVPYSSKVFMFSMGVGLGQEFIIKNRLVLQPYIGIFYKYARFTDKDLRDAIGEYNIIRTINGNQVGKVVDNAYGNLFTVDLGSRIAVRITKNIELGGSIGICPARFNSDKTLFGKYWGVKPYANNYYIKRLLFKADAGLRFNF